MNGPDSNNPTFYELLARAGEIAASLKSTRGVEPVNEHEMFDLQDELSVTLEQINTTVARWNKKQQP